MRREAELLDSASLPRPPGPDDEVRLACPQCGAGLTFEFCQSCGFHLTVSDGILDALLPARKTYYAHFIDDYEAIRNAEGRGSISEDFYLALPYNDLTGRNSGQWRIRSQGFDCLLEVLQRKLPASGGRVLDLGAGNGWMSYRLALAGYRPIAVDLLVNDADGLGAARHYRGRLPRLFPRVRAELSRLPFEQGQFDAAVFNASLHYAEDYAECLGEALRCLCPGGLVIVCDTPWYSGDGPGQQMLAERRCTFAARYGTTSDSIRSLGYLTDERLGMLEQQLSIRWTTYTPHYDLRWRLRPLLARLRRRREPSRFRIYAAHKPAP